MLPKYSKSKRKRCKDCTPYNQEETNFDTKKLSSTTDKQHKTSNHPNSVQDIHFNGGYQTAKLKHYNELACPGIENQ